MNCLQAFITFLFGLHPLTSTNGDFHMRPRNDYSNRNKHELSVLSVNKHVLKVIFLLLYVLRYYMSCSQQSNMLEIM